MLLLSLPLPVRLGSAGGKTIPALPRVGDMTAKINILNKDIRIKSYHLSWLRSGILRRVFLVVLHSRTGTESDYYDIIKDRKEIAMAATLLREISQDEHERARLRSRRMYETDKESDRLTSEEIGEIRGEARANEKWQVVVAEKNARIAQLEAELKKK